MEQRGKERKIVKKLEKKLFLKIESLLKIFKTEILRKNTEPSNQNLCEKYQNNLLNKFVKENLVKLS